MDHGGTIPGGPHFTEFTISFINRHFFLVDNVAIDSDTCGKFVSFKSQDQSVQSNEDVHNGVVTCVYS